MKHEYRKKKRTKIICTIGPSTNTKEKILELIENGMDLARLNFSHGTHKSHKETYELIRECELITGVYVGVLADLQGPKIRVGKIKDNLIKLEYGQMIDLIADSEHLGDEKMIGCSYEKIVDDLSVNDRILLDDGKLLLEVESKKEKILTLKTIIGGNLSSNKGINIPGAHLSTPALTPKDEKDLDFALDLGCDYIALSFVRRPEDLDKVLEKSKKSFTRVIAKIEKPEALQNIDAIVGKCDGIMIARGDLGVEVDTEKVPAIQKELIYKLNLKNKLVITATQMLESMIENPRPTRAEASDVANAVLDGTDAVMLSAESASGKYPVESVSIMSKIIVSSEQIYSNNLNKNQIIKEDVETIAISNACSQLAKDTNAKAIVNFTRSGYSGILVAKTRPKVPIYSFTPFLKTARMMSLCRGINPFVFPIMDHITDMIAYINRDLKVKNLVKEDDIIVLLFGTPGEKRSINCLQVHRIK